MVAISSERKSAAAGAAALALALALALAASLAPAPAHADGSALAAGAQAAGQELGTTAAKAKKNLKLRLTAFCTYSDYTTEHVYAGESFSTPSSAEVKLFAQFKSAYSNPSRYVKKGNLYYLPFAPDGTSYAYTIEILSGPKQVGTDANGRIVVGKGLKLG
ncbi:MAG: hypothetical protein IJ087_13640 [Eggerthellaceae bacterium]|nr:hypothetical protein [Eggerthellaceae bacterium]